MRKEELLHHEGYNAMLGSLNAYQKAGVRLTLSGRPSSPKEVAYACAVRENESYMSDFVEGESGKLKEIRFDRIKRIKK